jgi:hypothetical protein
MKDQAKKVRNDMLIQRRGQDRIGQSPRDVLDRVSNEASEQIKKVFEDKEKKK